MEQRTLGRSDLRIAPLAFGGNVFGWTADEATSFRLLDRFVDAGFNFIDTADVYSRWASGQLRAANRETIIGKWLKQGGKRDKVVIGTKVGIEMGPGKKGLSRAYIAQEVEDSLRRLQTDVIDLYMSHRDDPETPLRGDAGGFFVVDQAGQGAGDRRVQLQRGATERGAGNRAPRRACRATRACSRSTALPSAASSRASWRPCASASRSVSSATIRWQAGS